MGINIVSWTAKILGAASQFLMIRYLIRFLGIDQYAALAIINAFSIWLLLGDLGFGSALQNLYTWSRDDLIAKQQLIKMMLRIQFSLLIFGIPLTLLLSPLIGDFLFRSQGDLRLDLTFAFVLSNLIWILIAIGSINYKLLYSEDKGHFSNILPAIGSFVSLILVSRLGSFEVASANLFYLAILFISVPQLIAAGSGVFLFFSASSRLVRRHSPSAVDIRLRAVSNQAFQFLLTSVLIQATLNSDYLIMSQISSASEIAQYKIANSFFAFLYSLIYASLLILWPFCSNALAGGRYNEVIKKLRRTIYWGSVSIFGFVSLLLLLRRPISFLLSDGEVTLPAQLLIAFAFLYVARLIGDAFAVALASINKTKVFLAYLPLQLVIGCALSVWLGVWLGVLGIVLGLLVAFCLTHTWINIWYLYRLRRNFVA